MRLPGRVFVVMVCVLMLVGCGGEDSTGEPGDDGTPPSATPPPAASPMNVGPVIWTESIDATTGEPGDIVNVFTTQSPQIHAVIEVTDVPERTVFTATWTLNGLPIEGADMDISASEDLDHAWVTFSFTRDPGNNYPPGTLGVVITSSEGDVREGSIEIGFP